MTKPNPENKRMCCLCGVSCQRGAKIFPAGAPTIVTISLSVYRRTAKSRVMKPGGSITVCEPCLRGVGAAPSDRTNIRAAALGAAILQKLYERYNAAFGAQ